MYIYINIYIHLRGQHHIFQLRSLRSGSAFCVPPPGAEFISKPSKDFIGRHGTDEWSGFDMGCSSEWFKTSVG